MKYFTENSGASALRRSKTLRSRSAKTWELCKMSLCFEVSAKVETRKADVLRVSFAESYRGGLTLDHEHMLIKD